MLLNDNVDQHHFEVKKSGLNARNILRLALAYSVQ